MIMMIVMMTLMMIMMMMMMMVIWSYGFYESGHEMSTGVVESFLDIFISFYERVLISP